MCRMFSPPISADRRCFGSNLERFPVSDCSPSDCNGSRQRKGMDSEKLTRRTNQLPTHEPRNSGQDHRQPAARTTDLDVSCPAMATNPPTAEKARTDRVPAQNCGSFRTERSPPRG